LEYICGNQKKMFDKKDHIIPLDRFINNALYHPKKGYYMKKKTFGKNGDFITSPNISIIFSEMIFIWVISYWKHFYSNRKINIVELGAGNGEMMHQIIISSKKFSNFYKNCEFIIFEKSKSLIQVQKRRLKGCKVKWLKNLSKIANKPTIFLGNEFLDALPVKHYLKINNKWCERYVEKIKGIYRFKNVKFDIKNLEKKLNFNISKNQNFLEISFDEIKLIKKLNNFITKNGGSILFIDYAYSGRRMFDTLQGVKNHRKIDILSDVGNVDISHLINIPLLQKIVKGLKLEVSYKSQREFLLNLGILERAEILASKKSFLEKANIYYRINRLIDKKRMGDLFKVIHFYKKKSKFKLGFK
tara:strand:- start:658 stop:1731 length:1074 start_codon:yes stop_codon:yes gene_type:complete